MTPTIINIVSGKGGTGKTLLSCVLADMLGNSANSKTVVIDLDFFVRGLTSLLYFHQDEKLRIAPGESVTVSEFFTQKRIVPTENIAVLKYRSFEVVPAVARIDERLDFDDIGPNTMGEAHTILSALVASLGAQYRFILLDSRSGYDELVAAAHEISTASVCVEEQDPISRLTSDNLVAQLTRISPRKPLFRLVNKARGIKSQEEIVSGARSVTDLGVIPFDMDILNDFGTPNFWDTVNRSLYRWALARSWNILSSKLELGVDLALPRISPVVNETLETRFGFLATKERVLFVYGIVLAFFGVIYGIFGQEMYFVLRRDPTRFASLIAGFSGVVIAMYAFFKRR